MFFPNTSLIAYFKDVFRKNIARQSTFTNRVGKPVDKHKQRCYFISLKISIIIITMMMMMITIILFDLYLTHSSSSNNYLA